MTTQFQLKLPPKSPPQNTEWVVSKLTLQCMLLYAYLSWLLDCCYAVPVLSRGNRWYLVVVASVHGLGGLVDSLVDRWRMGRCRRLLINNGSLCRLWARLVHGGRL